MRAASRTCFAPATVSNLGPGFDLLGLAIEGIGDTVTALMLLQIPMLWFVYKYLPETKGRELEEISA